MNTSVEIIISRYRSFLRNILKCTDRNRIWTSLSIAELPIDSFRGGRRALKNVSEIINSELNIRAGIQCEQIVTMPEEETSTHRSTHGEKCCR